MKYRIFNEPIFNPNVSEANRELFLRSLKFVDDNFPDFHKFSDKIDNYVTQTDDDSICTTMDSASDLQELLETHQIYSNPRYPYIIQALLFHETFHLARHETVKPYGQKKPNLFEYIVQEGLALNLEEEIMRELNPEYYKEPHLQTILYKPSINKHLDELRSIVEDGKKYNHWEWMWGKNESFSYRLGYTVIKKYSKQNNKNLSDIYDVPWQVFWKFLKDNYISGGGDK